jgi:hypothetical protein
MSTVTYVTNDILESKGPKVDTCGTPEQQQQQQQQQQYHQQQQIGHDPVRR